MAHSLAGRVAVVSGAARGIGDAIAERLLADGARVFSLDKIAAEEPRKDVGYLEADVTDQASVAQAFKAIDAQAGQIDILVNNAGIQPLGVGFDGITGPLLERTFAVNVSGVAFGIKHAGRVLRDHGRVINIASFVGILATPGAAAYAPSKAAVIHLTRLAAIELAPRRITVNAVSPGTIRTPAVLGIPDNPEIPFIEQRAPLGRLGEPREVAALCHFLASDEAGYITGQNIVIDGGLTAGWTDYALVPPANVREGRWVDDR
jgi:NAD(P)-dependent dehydrogenase (short-subunit alcohol dehydrogenase family)